jgi:hypothetical protein
VAGSPKKRARREAAARAAAEQSIGSAPAAPISLPEAKTGEIMQPMNEELFAEILDRVADGSSLLKLSKEEGMPSRGVMQRWIKNTEHRSAL